MLDFLENLMYSIDKLKNTNPGGKAAGPNRRTKMDKQMSYEELVNHIEERKDRMTKWDVVCCLIGYQQVITAADWDNIMRLYVDNFVD